MLNTDATIFSNLQIEGLGGVFHNSSGDWILGFFSRIAIKDIMQLEIQALFLGLQLAVKYGLKPLEINMDAEHLSTILNSPDIDTNFSSLLADCSEQNRLADSLAKRAISTVQTSVLATVDPVMETTMFWTPLQDLLIILGADKRGDFVTRRVKTLRYLPPSTSVNIPTSMVFSVNGWSVNNAQYADTMVAVLPNDSL
ncbi:uncharacterized protein LOC107854107 [Capsicum annuum]|uniref:uncharacterized protein LOC107854107 n=1 Tax=Capsicum annuum TaxID=4072 RepID=UPI0007BF905B|nr:uncharacterized protein LOC107854107 [Capsicum annuum]